MSGGVRCRTVVSILLSAVLLSGCRPEDPEKQPQPGAPPAVQAGDAADTPAPPEDVPQQPPPPPKMPEVAMTQAMSATNLVGVGDTMPEDQLVDLGNQPHSLKELYGDKLTVVLFWNGDNLYAMQELQDLQIDFFEPYKEKGVQVIGINVRDTADVARQKVEQAGVTYPQLLDSDGSYFAKVAKEHLPRTLLLDAEGEVLWFDLEYSTATRRNLHQAIEVSLMDSGESTPAAPPSAGAAEAK